MHTHTHTNILAIFVREVVQDIWLSSLIHCRKCKPQVKLKKCCKFYQKIRKGNDFHWKISLGKNGKWTRWKMETIYIYIYMYL